MNITYKGLEPLAHVTKYFEELLCIRGQIFAARLLMHGCTFIYVVLIWNTPIVKGAHRGLGDIEIFLEIFSITYIDLIALQQFKLRPNIHY